MTIEPTEFDLIALARRGLQALLDEARAEVQLARIHAAYDERTGRLTRESSEARETAHEALTVAAGNMLRFSILHPPAETFEA